MSDAQKLQNNAYPWAWQLTARAPQMHFFSMTAMPPSAIVSTIMSFRDHSCINFSMNAYTNAERICQSMLIYAELSNE